jgi:hypothetical protein
MMVRKNHKARVVILLMAILFGFVLFAGSAMATPINGTIEFTGGFTLSGGSTLTTATTLDFGSLSVAAATGDLSGVSGNTTFQNLTYRPTPIPPATPFWSISGFSFDLTSFSVVSPPNDDYLVLKGTGTMYGPSPYDATVGSWSFSTLYDKFSFLSGTSVPDASIMLLLGPSLIGLGVLGRRKFRMARQ